MPSSSLNSDSGQRLLCRREVLLGFAFWTAFCILAVLLRGVRWDEQYEFAQVITGKVAYPPDHPYPYVTRGALNLQIYATALLYWLFPDAGVACGFRNMLYLMATVLPVYLLGCVLSGRALVGSAAAVLILMGIHEEFDACYQMFAWPGYASTGHVGLGYALVTLALFLGGHCRMAFFLLGLMPCVHIGQMPIVLAFAAVYSAVTTWRGGWRDLARALPWAAAGLGVCVIVWINKNAINVPLPATGPYYSAADPHAVWAGYVAQDGLRALPGRPTNYTNSFILLAATLLLCAAAAWLEHREAEPGAPRTWLWLGIYVGLCAAAVWGVMAIHAVLLDRVPYVLIAWMPYRFANHAAYVLLAALPAILADTVSRGRPIRRAGTAVLAMALLFSVTRPLLEAIVPQAVFARYFAGGEGVLFGLIGAAAAVLFLQGRSQRRFAGVWLITCLISVLVIAGWHHFGALCAAVGFGVTFGLDAWATRPRAAHFAVSISALAFITFLAAAALLAVQVRGRQHLPTTPFDRQVVDHLAQRGDTSAMLVARPEQYTLQAKTGHPVMADTCLAPWIPYMPSIGPSIEKITRDFYGETFSHSSEPNQPWPNVWRARTQEQWQVLAKEYSAHFVISPNNVPLNLPKRVSGELETLYEIP